MTELSHQPLIDENLPAVYANVVTVTIHDGTVRLTFSEGFDGRIRPRVSVVLSVETMRQAVIVMQAVDEKQEDARRAKAAASKPGATNV